SAIAAALLCGPSRLARNAASRLAARLPQSSLAKENRKRTTTNSESTDFSVSALLTSAERRKESESHVNAIDVLPDDHLVAGQVGDRFPIGVLRAVGQRTVSRRARGALSAREV